MRQQTALALCAELVDQAGGRSSVTGEAAVLLGVLVCCQVGRLSSGLKSDYGAIARASCCCCVAVSTLAQPVPTAACWSSSATGCRNFHVGARHRRPARLDQNRRRPALPPCSSCCSPSRLLRDTDARWRVSVGAAALLAHYSALDGLLQAVTGFSFGGPSDPQRLSGVFGAGNLKLGLVLAALSPLLLIPVQRRFGLRGLMLAGSTLLVVVFLAGARAGWLMLGLACCWRYGRSPAKARATLMSVAGSVINAGAGRCRVLAVTSFDARRERSMAAEFRS